MKVQKNKLQAKSLHKSSRGIAKGYSITFQTKLWKYQGKAAWYFVNLPQEESVQIKYRNALRTRGWGSLPVTVKIGETEWQTSIFPAAKINCYILPIKVGVRKNEKIEEGDVVEIVLSIN